MKKQIICGIGNRERRIRLELEKQPTYYDFLSLLLKEFDIRFPDLYNEQGNLPNIMEEADNSMTYDNDEFDFMEIIGSKRIFLIFETKESLIIPEKTRDKLSRFIEKHCKFKEPKDNSVAATLSRG